MSQDTILDNMRAQMRKGFLEFCILLAIARQEKAYASDILKELKANNLLVVEGTLYPLLSRLKNDDLLKYSWQESTGGPPRKYYTLTNKGVEQLMLFTKTWNELSLSINSLIKRYEKNN